jgi:hypothetical protein
MLIFNDNQAYITLIKDFIIYNYIKHIDIYYYYIKELIIKSKVIINYYFIKDIIINILIKLLTL